MLSSCTREKIKLQKNLSFPPIFPSKNIQDLFKVNCSQDRAGRWLIGIGQAEQKACNNHPAPSLPASYIFFDPLENL